MKTLTTITICSLILGIISSPLYAKGEGRQSKMKAELQARFDKDGDGKLSPSERKALQEYRKAARTKGKKK